MVSFGGERWEVCIVTVFSCKHAFLAREAQFFGGGLIFASVDVSTNRICGIGVKKIPGNFMKDSFTRTGSLYGAPYIKNKDRRLSLFLPALEEAKLEDLWFQQDGTTAHTATVSMNFLKENFSGRLIFLREDLLASALPGFSPLRLF
jgi:hypothetical protein